MRYRTTVYLGTRPIEVAGETIQDLLQEVEFVKELDRAREGLQAEPFFREWDGLEFYGLRSADGAEVLFGQHKKPSSPARTLFRYGPTSEGYRGWEKWDSDRCERVPVISAAVHDRFLQFIRDRGGDVADDAPFDPPEGKKGRPVRLKDYIRRHWSAIKDNAPLARSVARAVERSTGIRMEG